MFILQSSKCTRTLCLTNAYALVKSTLLIRRLTIFLQLRVATKLKFVKNTNICKGHWNKVYLHLPACSVPSVLHWYLIWYQEQQKLSTTEPKWRWIHISFQDHRSSTDRPSAKGQNTRPSRLHALEDTSEPFIVTKGPPTGRLTQSHSPHASWSQGLSQK